MNTDFVNKSLVFFLRILYSDFYNEIFFLPWCIKGRNFLICFPTFPFEAGDRRLYLNLKKTNYSQVHLNANYAHVFQIVCHIQYEAAASLYDYSVVIPVFATRAKGKNFKV